MSDNPLLEPLHHFADEVSAKLNQITSGEPEDQLRSPFENLMKDLAKAQGLDIVCIGETLLRGRLGKPDYAIHLNRLLVGYVELKAPGTGANPKTFTGHNKEQWNRFKLLPNVLYCDGNEWSLWRNGKAVKKLQRVSGNIRDVGKRAIVEEDAQSVFHILKEFLDWVPILPLNRNGSLDLSGFAKVLAPLCKKLRFDVKDALENSHSSFRTLAEEWRQLLFAEASDDQFADSYAQTVTFALLLARTDGADPLNIENAVQTLGAEHSLLSRALQVLTTEKELMDEISVSLNTIIRFIGEVSATSWRVRQSETIALPGFGDSILSSTNDPWFYFYEDFLAAYDPELRKNVGVYYTPVEVVRAQVRLVDELLTKKLGKPLGFADKDVITLDPAAGTGTYLLGVIEHALKRIEKERGKGAIPGQASELANNIYGFELLAGPFTITELRVSRIFRDREAQLPKDGTHIFLTDTLESPNATPRNLGLYYKPISDQHKKAIKFKKEIPVIVCLGNPPYDRHEAATPFNKALTGGWVRWGDTEDERDPIFNDFLNPAIEAGYGVDTKNLYNLYVYFWRWALWKVFEQESASEQGISSFISASSYLDGDAFRGMREHLRRICDELWIIDLGGEGRGTRRSKNIFDIQTPVAIAIAFRKKKLNKSKPAIVHYARIEGDRNLKLQTLDKITSFSKIEWDDCPDEWQAPFRPVGHGEYFNWPLLVDLMPWQHSGCQFKRTWPICHDPETLKLRWNSLLKSKNPSDYFIETRDRRVDYQSSNTPPNGSVEKPLTLLKKDSPAPKIVRYAYRTLDRQWILADNRLGDYLRPVLWSVHGQKQIYLSSSVVLELGTGPAITSSSHIPDLHCFAGRGGKDILPFYRDEDASEPNILPGLLNLLSSKYYNRKKVTPEALIGYVYGILAQPAFVEQYFDELESREIRIPITKDINLFNKVRRIGAKLLWLHTYGERFVPKDQTPGRIPPGNVRCEKAVPEDKENYPETFSYSATTRTLHVGKGEFKPVEKDVFEYEVSGLKVVQSWLKYRMKKGAGRKSSPLDDIRPERWTSQFTTELLELLWVLEATIAGYPEQAKLLEQVVSGPCFVEDELPPVPPLSRKPPKIKKDNYDLFNTKNNKR